MLNNVFNMEQRKTYTLYHGKCIHHCTGASTSNITSICDTITKEKDNIQFNKHIKKNYDICLLGRKSYFEANDPYFQ